VSAKPEAGQPVLEHGLDDDKGWAGNVRSLGVTDPEVKPNHAWRETFKQVGHRYISERILDAIAGHAPISVGRGYGLPTLADMAAALNKFPRYETE
jgi:hypothetical protein